MKRFNTKTILLTLASLLVLFLVACNGDDGDSATSSDPAEESDEPVKLTFLIDNQSAREGLEAVAKDIEEKFNIVTEFELRPGGNEGDNIVKTRLATGEMTDLMWYNSGSLFQALNPEEYFLDLSGEPFMERVTDEFKVGVSVGDGVYGIPGESTFAGGWLYNKNVYEELGLEIPTTWEELLENNDKIKEAGIVPVAASYQDTWTAQLVLLGDYYNVHSEDPDFADKFTHNEAKFATTPIAKAGFEKQYDLYENGHFNDEASSTTYEKALEMLATGEAAHYPMLTLALPVMEERFPEEVNDIGFFGQPGDDANDHGMTVWLPATIAVNKDSDKIDAAKKWLEYFVSDEGIETYLSVMKPFGPFALEDVDMPEDSYTAVLDMMEYQEAGKTSPALEFLSPLKGPNLEQILVEVGLGMSTPDEAADKYDRDVERQAQQLDLEGW